MSGDTVPRALLEEIRWLRAEVERMRRLPTGAFVLEGILVDVEESTGDDARLVQEGRVISTEGSWRIRQVHHDRRTDRWWTSLHIVREDGPRPSDAV